MASTFAVTRNHLIFGLCLPLAVLLGYTLADVQDPASRIVILIALAVLSVPLLMKWYHPVLVLSWNSVVQFALLGNLNFWCIMAVAGLFIAVLNRSINARDEFLAEPALTRPILVLTAVVVVIAMTTGGIGLRILGSQLIGGKSYVWIFAAVAGFFAFSSRSIPESRAYLYAAMFFLPGLTSMIGRFAIWSGVGLDYVVLFFPLDAPPDALGIDKSEDFGAIRISGVVLASTSVFCWVLARHGIAGTFDFSKPWRFLILLGAGVLGMFGGFRSAIILCGLVFAILFCLERLWRTRAMGILVAVVLIGGGLVAGFADKLPLTMQRTLSFLPFNFDPVSKLSAEASTEWRLEMWRRLLPQVPQYLFKGKGYTISADELFMVREAEVFGAGTTIETSTYAGDYHNGLLSIVMPLGVYGVLAFFWLVIAGARFLYRMHQESPPALRQINAFLFALFLARILFFIFVFGSLASDLFQFLGILGFSVALNVRTKREPIEADEPATQEA
jgi:hypothetical protein